MHAGPLETTATRDELLDIARHDLDAAMTATKTHVLEHPDDAGILVHLVLIADEDASASHKIQEFIGDMIRTAAEAEGESRTLLPADTTRRTLRRDQ